MHSALPKALHILAGKPLLQHVLDAVKPLAPDSLNVVYGHGGEQVQQAFGSDPINWVYQARQNGTGEAVQLALDTIDRPGYVLVLYADVPNLSTALLQELIEATDKIGILTACLSNPSGYGRVIRRDKHIVQIIEQKDASKEQLKIKETNTGVVFAHIDLLRQLLERVDNNNAQQEIYLTDVIALARDCGYVIDSVVADDPMQAQGINDKNQLIAMERHLQHQQAQHLLSNGVTIQDPKRIDIRGSLVCGRDVTIDVNCVFIGQVELADGVVVGPHVVMSDSVIGTNTIIKSHCVIENARVDANGVIGPFARLRPGAELADEVQIGNFVEIKNTRIDKGSKVNHLSYIGDSQVGQQVNIGAGTITCNYDGIKKHRTIIEDQVFIGSGNELVAPIQIGKGAMTGAGSTLSDDVAPDSLVVERGKRISKTRLKNNNE